MFEERAARRSVLADRPVASVEKLEHGMGEKGEEYQTGQQGGKMLFESPRVSWRPGGVSQIGRVCSESG
jgi:hypothetical protein